MSQEETLTIDPQESIKNNVDALGKTWKVYYGRGSGLCFARPDPDRTDAVIPDNMKGRWTKPSLLQEQITKYVTETWEKAAKADKALERKREAAREQLKKTKEKE